MIHCSIAPLQLIRTSPLLSLCLPLHSFWTGGMHASSVNLGAFPAEIPSIRVHNGRSACDGKMPRQAAKINCQASGALAQDECPGLTRGFTAVNGRPAMSPSEQHVFDVVLKQVAVVNRRIQDNQGPSLEIAKPGLVSTGPLDLLSEAYMRCGQVCEEYAKTFYLGTMLMTPERRKAIWAIYVWCRRTDELVDGPNAPHITPSALDRWQQRLEDIFEGKPYDMFDAALADTVFRFPIDIQPFQDMIDGMRMDLVKARYQTFDELYLYCYYVAGTVGLMSVPVMGIPPESTATTESVFNAALALGIANQLTNILRDVGEDARRGRIYLPRDELAQFSISESDIFAGQVTDKWRAFMKEQIKRARMFFDISEKGVGELDKDSRWPVWASLTLYKQILDSIEANDYDNFTKRAYVGKWKKIFSLPAAYVRALVPPSSVASKGSKNLSLKC